MYAEFCTMIFFLILWGHQRAINALKLYFVRTVSYCLQTGKQVSYLPGSLDGEINEGYKVCFMTDT